MDKIKKIKCPVCGKKTDLRNNPYKPFCSERCRLIDLGKWADGRYKIRGKKRVDNES